MEDEKELKELRKQVKKLSRENRQLEHELELIRTINEQVSRTQGFIQRESHKQNIYNDQLLRTSPYLLVMTNEELDTVMASDAFCRLAGQSREDIEHGLHLGAALQGVMPEADVASFIQLCQRCLDERKDRSFLLNTVMGQEERTLRVEISNYMDSSEAVMGLNILFVDMTEIVEAKERAENADKAKSNFLANMSHEIRTPMNAIYGMAEFILRDSTDAEAKENASMIKSAAKSLITIINDILDFSKIESGRMELIEDSYSLASLIKDVSGMINIRLQNKDVALKQAVSPALPDMLYGDEVRVKQVLINLLNNSVKFTKKGCITILMRHERVDADTCRIFVSIADTGIGIREEDLKKIFETFTRVDTKRNRSVEGTGLGLAISRRLVEMMGGELTVKSTYGKGSVFSFSILSKVENWTSIGYLKSEAGDTRARVFEAEFSAPEAKILVVDDNEMNLKVAQGILRPYQIKADCVDSGGKSIIAAAKEDYDIIFMDHMMPGIDGVEAMQKIRSIKNREHSIIFALTANALSGGEEYYRRIGFSGFLAKPIEPKEMDSVLRNYLPEYLVHEKNPRIPSRAQTAGGQEPLRVPEGFVSMDERLGSVTSGIQGAGMASSGTGQAGMEMGSGVSGAVLPEGAAASVFHGSKAQEMATSALHGSGTQESLQQHCP